MYKIMIVLMVFGLVGCDKLADAIRPEKKPNVNVSIYKIEPTETHREGSVVRVEYPLGKLEIPIDYYRSGDVNPNYAHVDLYITWPEMVGYHAGGISSSDPRVLRLFTTFEKEKGTRFKGDDYYIQLQQRIKDGRVEYIRPSPQYEGLTEYWSTISIETKEQMKKRATWHVYYLANEPEITSPEGHRLIIRCWFRGMAPELLENRPERKECKMQWNIDDSMSIETRLDALILDDWKTMYHGLKTFVNNIRAE